MPKKFDIFKCGKSGGDFQKVDVSEETPLHRILRSDSIFLFIDYKYKTVWKWEGKDVPIRMRLLAREKARNVRDKFTFKNIPDSDIISNQIAPF